MDSSNLSSPRYGFSFVVAVTQESINGAIKQFLSKLREPLLRVCYVADENGNEVQGDFASLGVDPFQIPSTSDVKSPKIQKLNEARFLRGFEARLGLPPMSDPSKTPDLVQLGFQTSAVTFTMMCSQFTVVQYVEGGRFGKDKWVNVSQQKDKPWTFRAKVDMTMVKVGKEGFGSLPPDVQRKIKNISSSAFSVQQLLFDLNNAALAATQPEIAGVPKEANTMLQETFLGSYFKQMRKDGNPLLACVVTEDPPSQPTLTLTDFNFNVCPYMDKEGKPVEDPTEDQKAAATLNYLCAADGVDLPPPVPFTWNWVDTSELNDHHGIIAINRNSFSKYIETNIEPYIRQNCIEAIPIVTYEPPIEVSYGHKIKYLDPSAKLDFVRHETGSTVLSFNWNKDHSDSTWGELYRMEMGVTYSLDVEFTGKRIVLKQNMKFRLKINKDTAWADANVINKTITDVSTLGVDDEGKATAEKVSTPKDDSETGSINDISSWFTGFNTLMSQVKSSVLPAVSVAFGEIPVSIVSDYVFPGGRTFVLKDVRFSSHQDLLASSTYLEA